MADEQTNDGPEIPAAGGNLDSRKRALKTELAAAEASGDERGAAAARKALAAVDEELQAAQERSEAELRERAAADRKAMAGASGDEAEARKAAPAGRATKTEATGQKS